jgi:hypothetical protein
MPFNGSGSFSPAITFVDNTPATAGDQNTQDVDIAGGLTNCITRDGQSPAHANLPMGAFKLTQLGAGSVNSDSVNLGQVATAFPFVNVISPVVEVTGAAATQRPLQFQTAGSNRWILYADNTAESGSNAGSNFGVNAYADDGVTILSTPFTINRSTGIINFANPIQVGGSTIVMPGTMIAWPSTTVPTGYLEMNGASLSTTTYAALFAVMQYTFGGSGASFTLPDFRSEFMRGWDHGRGVDPSRTFGSSQADLVGPFVSSGPFYNTSNGGVAGAGGAIAVIQSLGNSQVFGGGAETRPKNIAIMFLVKY